MTDKAGFHWDIGKIYCPNLIVYNYFKYLQVKNLV